MATFKTVLTFATTKNGQPHNDEVLVKYNLTEENLKYLKKHLVKAISKIPAISTGEYTMTVSGKVFVVENGTETLVAGEDKVFAQVSADYNGLVELQKYAAKVAVKLSKDKAKRKSKKAS